MSVRLFLATKHSPLATCVLWWIVTDQKGALSGREAILLQQPRFKSTSGNQAFTLAVPQLWNSLPEELRLIHRIQEKTRNALVPQSLPTFVIKFEIHCDWIRAPLSHLRIGAL